jgi:CheY-like chemotaxis protein
LEGLSEINLTPYLDEVRSGKNSGEDFFSKRGELKEGYKIRLSLLRHNAITFFILFIQGPDAFDQTIFQIPEPEEIDEELLRGIRVLMADDDTISQLIARNFSRKWEIEVVVAETGKHALEELAHSKFDLVLMDIQMPVMDGMEATLAIRNTMKLNVPIIALTGSLSPSDKEKYLSIGMNDCILKPLNQREFYDTAVKVLNLQPQVDQTPVTSLFTEPVQENLYNLERLKVIAAGDQEFIQKMIQLFLSQSVENIEKINDAVHSGDLDKLKGVAHKMKPSVNILGISAITDIILKIEGLNAEAVTTDVHQLTERLTQLLNMVCEDLKSKNVL